MSLNSATDHQKPKTIIPHRIAFLIVVWVLFWIHESVGHLYGYQSLFLLRSQVESLWMISVLTLPLAFKGSKKRRFLISNLASLLVGWVVLSFSKQIFSWDYPEMTGLLFFIGLHPVVWVAQWILLGAEKFIGERFYGGNVTRAFAMVGAALLVARLMLTVNSVHNHRTGKCDRQLFESERFSCLLEHHTLVNFPCDRWSSQTHSDTCWLLKGESDASFCLKVVAEAARTRCLDGGYFDQAESTGNKSFCQKISSPRMRENCNKSLSDRSK